MPGNKNSGRPPKPTEKLKLYGTYRKDRHGKRRDTSKLKKPVKMPDDLHETEQNLWERIIPDLEAAGMLKTVDESALRGMIEWLARYRLCVLWLKRRQVSAGFDGDSDSLDEVARIQNMAEKAWKQFFTVASRFGMSPSDRNRLSAEAEPIEDEFEQDLKHG